MRIEIHLDDAPEFGTEAVRKAVGISRQDDPKTRSVIYYEQPESVVEVSAEVLDPEFGQFISVLTVRIPVHALRAALRDVEGQLAGRDARGGEAVTDPNDDIDELLDNLDGGYWPEKHAALTALVAERDVLRRRVAAQDADLLAAANAILHGRIEPHPPADRDRELRERLVCAALTGLMAYSGQSSHRTFEQWADVSVRQADATLAAMRKGERDGK